MLFFFVVALVSMLATQIDRSKSWKGQFFIMIRLLNCVSLRKSSPERLSTRLAQSLLSHRHKYFWLKSLHRAAPQCTYSAATIAFPHIAPLNGDFTMICIDWLPWPASRLSSNPRSACSRSIGNSAQLSMRGEEELAWAFKGGKVEGSAVHRKSLLPPGPGGLERGWFVNTLGGEGHRQSHWGLVLWCSSTTKKNTFILITLWFVSCFWSRARKSLSHAAQDKKIH